MPTPLYLNQDNTSEKKTLLTRNSPGEVQVATLALFASNPDSYGLRAYGTGRGSAVFGINIDAHSEAKGVHGWSTGGGIGVVGEAMDERAKREEKLQHGIGVYGKGPDFGVHGNGDYAGVSGISKRNGVEGHSDKEAGVYGYSYEGVGVVADSHKGDAGRFYGNVSVKGDLNVQGAKSAVVPFPDGSLRRLYCQESPESWFEDFGEAKLVKGSVVVPLDDDYAAVIAGDYHVFLTPLGDCNGLYVSERRRGEFEVKELNEGTHTLHFSYRVVARRKDIAAPRFDKVHIPERPERSRFPDFAELRPGGDADTAD